MIGLEQEMQSLRLAISKQPNTAENKESRKPLKTKAFGVVYGAPEGTRTPDLPLRRRTLYPTELLARISNEIVNSED